MLGTRPGQDAVAPRASTEPELRGRRLYRRVVIEAAIEIDGAPCRLIDVSVGGFAVAEAPPKLVSQSVAAITLRMPIDGIEIATTMRAQIVYADGSRAAGRFLELTASQTALLRYLVTWRDDSLGRAGTTGLLDSITRRTESARLPEAVRQLEPPRKAPWWTRWFGRLGRTRS